MPSTQRVTRVFHELDRRYTNMLDLIGQVQKMADLIAAGTEHARYSLAFEGEEND